MRAPPRLRRQVAGVRGGQVHARRHQLGDGHPEPAQLPGLVRVVAEQGDPRHARAPAASARRPGSCARPRRGPARRSPRRCRAPCPAARRRRAWRTGRCRAPPAAGTAGSRRSRRCARRPRAAAARSRSAGCRTRRRSGTRCAAGPAAPTPGSLAVTARGAIAEPEGEVLPAVDEPVEAEHAGGRGVPVGEPQGHGTWVRIVAVGSGSGIGRLAQSVRNRGESA